MGAVAFVFPGQGSQYVGMLRDFLEGDPASRAMIEEADRILGVPLSDICTNGPEEELRQTKNTQPAIFLHSMVVARSLTRISPSMAAGHSLGEYSALVVAGALEFEDALRLVRLRGELMQRAGEEQRGTMAAVVGLAPEALAEVCAAASPSGVVQPANFNSPGQVVISGSVEGVRRAMELARGEGAKMVKELVVSGAFHSPLMAGAGEGLRDGLARVRLRDTAIPVYANVTARPVRAAEEIRDLLYRQLTSPVRWDETVRNMAADGAAEFVELGPGKVLQGLVKRTAAQAATRGFDTLADLRAAGGPTP
jgi:[acyl-carrier-protein] S-malonyltransferase